MLREIYLMGSWTNAFYGRIPSKSVFEVSTITFGKKYTHSRNQHPRIRLATDLRPLDTNIKFHFLFAKCHQKPLYHPRLVTGLVFRETDLNLYAGLRTLKTDQIFPTIRFFTEVVGAPAGTLAASGGSMKVEKCCSDCNLYISLSLGLILHE